MSSNRTTNNYELFDYLKKYGKKFGGVMMKDEMFRLKPNGKFWIINLDDSSGGGSHWCLLADKINNDCCMWIDPYGVYPPPEVVEFMKKSKASHLLFNKTQYQDLESTNCGYFCIYFAEQLLNGKVYDYGLKEEDDLEKNDKLLNKKYINKGGEIKKVV